MRQQKESKFVKVLVEIHRNEVRQVLFDRKHTHRYLALRRMIYDRCQLPLEHLGVDVETGRVIGVADYLYGLHNDDSDDNDDELDPLELDDGLLELEVIELVDDEVIELELLEVVSPLSISSRTSQMPRSSRMSANRLNAHESASPCSSNSSAMTRNPSNLLLATFPILLTPVTPPTQLDSVNATLHPLASLVP